jgi:glycosyltransferase involved in cell wall biosynthesis
MIPLLKRLVDAVARDRGPLYAVEVRAAVVQEDADHFYLNEEDYHAIRAKWTGAKAPAIATPRVVTLEQKEQAIKRAQICAGCRECGKISLNNGKFDVYSVGCKQCGCGGLSLVAGQCPAGRWDEVGAEIPRGVPVQFETGAGQKVALRDLYAGQSAFLICGGPSLSSMDLSPLRAPGMLTMGVNNSAKVFRPNLWISVDEPDRFLRSIFFDPTVMKFVRANHRGHEIFDSDAWAWTGKLAKGCPNVHFYPNNDYFDPRLFLNQPTVNWGNSKDRDSGRSVMLAAIRILYELGIRNIYLVGADFRMSADYAYAFDQARAQGAVNNNNNLYRTLNMRFTLLRPIFEKAGLHVINCTPESGLTAFDHLPLAEAVEHVKAAFGVDVANEKTAGLYDAEKPARGAGEVQKVSSEYDVTVITPTGDRPAAFALAEKWMARQTFKGRIQWVVVDDGEVPTVCTMGQTHVRREKKPDDPKHTLPMNLAAGIRAAKSDKVLVMEDDDWYSPIYVETMTKRLDEADLVGDNRTIYYRHGFGWKCLNNRGHASLAATGFKGKVVLDQVVDFCERIREAFIDLHMWRHCRGTKKIYERNQSKPIIVQMKGMPGRPGQIRHHWSDQYHPDPGKKVLRGWIGDDVDVYNAAIDTTPTLTVLLPTISRPTLPAMLESLKQLDPRDELIVVCEGKTDTIDAIVEAAKLSCRVRIVKRDTPSNDWGNTPRRLHSPEAKGEYLLYGDDDDIYTPGAFAAIRSAIMAHRGKMIVFRMDHVHPATKQQYIVPTKNVVALGQIGTTMVAIPNDPSRWGSWETRERAGDFKFYSGCKFDVVWNDAIIYKTRPHLR